MKKTVILLLICSLFLACSKKEFSNSYSPSLLYQELWNDCNNKYSFFNYKNIDWDSINLVYQTKVNEDMNDLELFDTLGNMLKELKDGHVNLVSPFQVMKYEFDLKAPVNFNYRVIRENYLSDNYYQTGSFIHDTLNSEISYIRYSSFSNPISDFDLDFILSRYRNCKGLIIDIRENGGGSLFNIFKLLNRFCKTKTALYNSYLKNGPDENDYSGPQTAYCEPEGDYRFTKKIVLLTNRSCFSASSFFTLSMKELENCTVLGDTTGGGLGTPNGGQLSNGWTYRFSVSKTISMDDKNFENGVPPDEVVYLKNEELEMGIDAMMERAKEIIKPI